MQGTSRIIRQYFYDNGRRSRITDVPTFVKDVCVAIESFSRNAQNVANEEGEQEYEERYNRIMQSIENVDKKWLTDKLRYANEASLRKRFKQILKELSENYPSIKESMKLNNRDAINAIVGRVVDTRNFYTHYDLKSRKNIYDDHEALVISTIILELLRVLVLQEIGLSKELLNSFMQDNRTFHDYCQEMNFSES